MNKSWKQHPTKQQLYGHLLPISTNIQVKRARHVGNCWKSKDDSCNVLPWSPTYGRASFSRPARTGYSLEDLPGAMDDRDEWKVPRKSMLSMRLDDDNNDLIRIIYKPFFMAFILILWPWQMAHAKTRTRLRKWNALDSRRLWDANGAFNSDLKTRSSCWLVMFCIISTLVGYLTSNPLDQIKIIRKRIVGK